VTLERPLSARIRRIPVSSARNKFETLAFRAGLAPVRFHDLRHGAASQCKAAGVDTKVISALLGHSRTDFPNRTYVLVFPEVAKAAAEAAAAIVPRCDTGNGGR
jgi:integrase